MSEKTCGSCHTSSQCQTQGHSQQGQSQDQKLQDSLARIKNKLVILSGKGGVGKSSLAANLAVGLAMSGYKVGLMDVDVHGPSIPRLFGMEGTRPVSENQKLIPVIWNGNLAIMSLGFLLPNREESVIWRGPVKMGLIRQFLEDVDWGELDYLLVDCPPGTGDEPLSVVQLLGSDAQAVVVTSPQDIAVDDVRRSINFCQQTGNPVLGIVENMSGYVCPHCQQESDIFSSGGGQRLAQEMGVNFLGGIPLDPEMVQAADQGKPYIFKHRESPAVTALEKVLEPIKELASRNQDQGSRTQIPVDDSGLRPNSSQQQKDNGNLKIAIPLVQDKLCTHFGHCEQFALLEVNPDQKSIEQIEQLTPPPHEPGVLPKWLAQQQASLVIAGGMGSKAQELLRDYGVRVITGVKEGSPRDIVQAYLEDRLETGENLCDH